jgi:hypothetical protein
LGPYPAQRSAYRMEPNPKPLLHVTMYYASIVFQD